MANNNSQSLFQGKPPTAPPQINYLKEIIFPHKKTKEKKTKQQPSGQSDCSFSV